jgi:Transposase DDE domain
MRRPQNTVTSRAIHDHAAALCQKQLRLRDYGPKCPAHTLLALLFYAAARVTSLAAACGSLSRAPSDTAVRTALRATLPKIDELQRRLNRALQDDFPKALRRRRQALAIDLTLLPYHGQPREDDTEVYRGQAKDGTSHFHAYATAYVIRKGQRYTAALAYVRQGDDLAAVVQGLLRQAARAGIRPRYLLLDRGFYQVSVIRHLQAARCPFLMPAPAKGRKADHPKGPSGTRVFHLSKRGGWSSYTLTASDGRTATVSICVKCRNYRGQWQRHGRQALVYAFWGLAPSSGQWVYQTYRLRFGIETTYRQLREARVRTCTRDPLLRLLYVGVALVLRNVWVWLHWEVLSEPRRGGRRIDLNQLPFRALLAWIQQLIESLLIPWDAIAAQRPMPT